MSGRNDSIGADGALTIQRALDIARNSESGVDSYTACYLNQALGNVWARLQAAPDTYILTKDEFALFNYFRDRFAASEIAQRAVRRFWDNYYQHPTREF